MVWGLVKNRMSFRETWCDTGTAVRAVNSARKYLENDMGTATFTILNHQGRQRIRAIEEAAAAVQRAGSLAQRQAQAVDFDFSNVGSEAAQGISPRAYPRPKCPGSTTASRFSLMTRPILEGIMNASPFLPTQHRVFNNRINNYVQRMINDQFDWNNPLLEPLETGSANEIVSGHHRLIAAQIASRFTGRPVTGEAPSAGSAIEPIIPDGRWVRLAETSRQVRGRGRERMAVEHDANFVSHPLPE